MPKRNLTTRQKRFCDEYLACLNATEAAIKAGYNAKNARITGCKNLTNANIREYIDQCLAAKDKQLIAEQDEILQYFTALGRGELTDVVVTNNGKKVLAPATIRDRTRAFELLGRVYGIFNDKLHVSEPVPVIISGSDDLED